MKRVLFITGLILISLISYSQEIADKTIGLRFGDDDGLGAEITFQKSLGSNNRLEAGLAWRSNNNIKKLKVNATYQWVWDLEMVDNMNWYAGAGAGLGSWTLTDTYIGSLPQNSTYLFVSGIVGIEYNFESIPLLLSLDFRPEFGFSDFTDGLGLDFAFGVRYAF